MHAFELDVVCRIRRIENFGMDETRCFFFSFLSSKNMLLVEFSYLKCNKNCNGIFDIIMNYRLPSTFQDNQNFQCQKGLQLKARRNVVQIQQDGKTLHSCW